MPSGISVRRLSSTYRRAIIIKVNHNAPTKKGSKNYVRLHLEKNQTLTQ